MVEIIKVNNQWLPEPDGELKVSAEKVKSENQTEAGTTQVIVTRVAKLTIQGTWNLSGTWVQTFRGYRDADTVTVEVYYPSATELSTYTCQFDITDETHDAKARAQVAGGLYTVSVTMTEL